MVVTLNVSVLEWEVWFSLYEFDETIERINVSWWKCSPAHFCFQSTWVNWATAENTCRGLWCSGLSVSEIFLVLHLWATSRSHHFHIWVFLPFSVGWIYTHFRSRHHFYYILFMIVFIRHSRLFIGDNESNWH